jgi:hypothetical protein
MPLRWFSALLWIAALAGLSPALPAAKPAPPKLTDAQIEAAIQKKFAASKIAANGFTINVHSGVAVIQGKTAIVQHKGTATRLAKNAGARRVDNRVVVDKAGREKASASLRDARRRAKVVRSQPR